LLAGLSSGDPGRSSTPAQIKRLDWQIGLSAFIEAKRLFGALANELAARLAYLTAGTALVFLMLIMVLAP
jgi:hypothetical protein